MTVLENHMLRSALMFLSTALENLPVPGLRRETRGTRAPCTLAGRGGVQHTAAGAWTPMCF